MVCLYQVSRLLVWMAHDVFEPSREATTSTRDRIRYKYKQSTIDVLHRKIACIMIVGKERDEVKGRKMRGRGDGRGERQRREERA